MGKSLPAVPGNYGKRKPAGSRLTSVDLMKHEFLSLPDNCLKKVRLFNSAAKVERTVVTKEEEERLVAWIKECARRGFGRTMGQIQLAVQSILNQRKAVTVFKDNFPGYKWVTLFLRRHKDVSLRTPRALRAEETRLRVWFETARHEIQAAGGDVLDHSSRIFNCDEIGFQLGKDGFSKVLDSKGDRRAYQMSTDNHSQITVLVCGSASGEVHSPLIIFPGQRFSYDPLEGFPEAHFAKSHHGWIDGEIFTAWLKTAFIPATEHLPKPIVLFADGHKTHLTLTVSELCSDHCIILYQLPSHSSHKVQPLNLTTLERLKRVWREEVLDFQEEKSKTVVKKDFSRVLKKAWERGIKKNALISGFRAAGLYPWNPDHVDMAKLGPPQPFVTPSTETEIVSKTETVPTTELIPEATETDNLTLTLVTETLPTLELNPEATETDNLTSTSLLPSHVTSSSSSTTTVSLSSSSSNVISPTSSHNIVASTCTSSFRPDNMPRQMALDRLLDLAIKAGHDKLTRYKTLYTLGLETDDPEERLFCSLYNRLIRQNDNTAEERTCDNLPMSSGWTQENEQTLQPPEMVSDDNIGQYVKKEEDER